MLADAAAAPAPVLRARAGGQGRRRARPPPAAASPGAPRGLTTELARTAAGRSQLAPARGDRRFADPAWQENWLLRRLLQAYLAVGETVDGLIADAALDWRTERQARFAAGNVLDALAPTNFPWSNPPCSRRSSTRGGANLAAGRAASPATVHAAAPAGHRRHEPVRGRRQPGRHARARWCCAPRCSS